MRGQAQVTQAQFGGEIVLTSSSYAGTCGGKVRV